MTGLDGLRVYSNRIAREVLPGRRQAPRLVGQCPDRQCRLDRPARGARRPPRRCAPRTWPARSAYRAYFDMTTLGDVFAALGMPRDALELLLGLPKGPEAPRFKPTPATYRHLPRMATAVVRDACGAAAGRAARSPSCGPRTRRSRRPTRERLDERRAPCPRRGADGDHPPGGLREHRRASPDARVRPRPRAPAGGRRHRPAHRRPGGGPRRPAHVGSERRRWRRCRSGGRGPAGGRAGRPRRPGRRRNRRARRPGRAPCRPGRLPGALRPSLGQRQRLHRAAVARGSRPRRRHAPGPPGAAGPERPRGRTLDGGGGTDARPSPAARAAPLAARRCLPRLPGGGQLHLHARLRPLPGDVPRARGAARRARAAGPPDDVFYLSVAEVEALAGGSPLPADSVADDAGRPMPGSGSRGGASRWRRQRTSSSRTSSTATRSSRIAATSWCARDAPQAIPTSRGSVRGPARIVRAARTSAACSPAT